MAFMCLFGQHALNRASLQLPVSIQVDVASPPAPAPAPVLPQELPANLTVEQAQGPGCAKLVQEMCCMLGTLKELSRLRVGLQQEVGGWVGECWVGGRQPCRKHCTWWHAGDARCGGMAVDQSEGSLPQAVPALMRFEPGPEQQYCSLPCWLSCLLVATAAGTAVHVAVCLVASQGPMQL